jgi:uncharacterized repeat protein (TIGR01451 family)
MSALAKTFRHLLAVSVLLTLTLMAPPTPRTLAAPLAYSVRSDVDDQLYQIDLATGIATAIGPVGFDDVEGLAFNCTGVLYGVDDITEQLITINLATGAGAAVGPLNIAFPGFQDAGLTFDTNGNLWMSTDIPQNFYSINPATGAATLVGAQGQPVTGLAFAAGVLYGLDGAPPNNLVTINPATGAATNIGALGAVSLNDGGIDFDLNGTLWGISAEITPTGGPPSQVFTINTSTGTATGVAAVTVGGIQASGFESLAINTLCAPIPTATATLTVTPTATSTTTVTPTLTPTPTATPTATTTGPTLTPTSPLPPAPPPTNPPPPPPTDVPPPPPPALNDPLIAKSASVQTAQVGDPVQFTITVFNPNSVTLPNVVVTDTLPAQLDFVSASVSQGSFTFDAGSHIVTFNVNDLGALQSATLVMQTVVNDKGQPGDVLRNVAVVSVNGQAKGQAEAAVQLIPGLIPVTGLGPRWNESALIMVLALLAFLLPGAFWLRRARVKNVV